MGYKVGVTFLLLGLIVFNVIRAQSNQCRTPNGNIGTCINIKRCPELLLILTEVPINPAGISYLRNSQCGFEDRDPLVCCAARNPSSNSYPNRTDVSGDRNGNGCGNNGDCRDTSSLLPTDCGRDLSNRIVGGVATELDEFPWMVLLEYRKPKGNTTACGGVLISKRYVLTAAHCITGRSLPRDWRLTGVRLGEYNTATLRDCIPDGNDSEVCADPVLTMEVEEQLAHEDYQPRVTGEKHDIALLRLARDVPFSNFVKPICLPSSPSLNQKFHVAGWGKTETKSESEVKLKVGVVLADRQACEDKYLAHNIKLGEGQICAGGETGKDSCRGDSGGPLMQQDRMSDGSLRWRSVGVVSFGPTPCGMSGWPGVYTKVYDYMPWILSKLRA